MVHCALCGFSQGREARPSPEKTPPSTSWSIFGSKSKVCDSCCHFLCVPLFLFIVFLCVPLFLFNRVSMHMFVHVSVPKGTENVLYILSKIELRMY